MPRLRAAVIALAVCVAGLPLAHAASTSPTLAISAAAGAGGGGGYGVAIEGTFDFENAVQVGYPLQLVVFQGTGFVRFQVAGPVVTGTSALLANGTLDSGELNAFLAEGTPAPAGVRIVTLTRTGARVTLPGSFTSGTATAVLFVVLADGSVVSNHLAFTLP